MSTPISKIRDPDRDEFLESEMQLASDMSSNVNILIEGIQSQIAPSGKKIKNKELSNIIKTSFKGNVSIASKELSLMLESISRDPDSFVDNQIIFEIEALRSGAETAALTKDLVGKLNQRDIMIAHKMLLSDNESEEEIAESLGMTEVEMKSYISKTKYLQDYMQNILNANKTYENIQRIRHEKVLEKYQRAVDSDLKKVADKIVESYQCSPEKQLKLLANYRRTLTLKTGNDNNNIVINANVQNDNRSVSVDGAKQPSPEKTGIDTSIQSVLRANNVSLSGAS